MRDRSDNVVVVCSIENIDAMGVHTGDSVTVAPAMTLTDREYQQMRDVGIAVLRAVGVDTGGCNIQFAVHPADRAARRHRDEPAGLPLQRAGVEGHRLPDRQDRREAGHRLHPRRDHQRHHRRHPGGVRADAGLRRGQDPAVRVREVPRRRPAADHDDEERRRGHVAWAATSPRRWARRCGRRRRRSPASGPGTRTDRSRRGAPGGAAHARSTAGSTSPSRRSPPGATVERSPRPAVSIHGSSTRSRWCREIGAAVRDAPSLTPELLRRAKRFGLSDRQVAALRPELAGEDGVRTLRWRLGIRPVYKTVDTCAAEFAAQTPYHYSSYDEETEVRPREKPAVLILGSGPNRIGQGIEFDYSCVHAVMALQDAGYEAVMVNCNPETVSTDYDTADRLYFEPLTFEDVLEVVEAERGGRAGGRGHLHARRPDAARPGAAAQGRRGAGAGHLAGGDRPRRAPRRVLPRAARHRAARPEARDGDDVRRGPRDRRGRSATRCWCGRPTCSAAAAWRSSTTTPRSRPTSPRPPTSARSTRCWSTGSWRTPSRSTSTPSTTAPSSTSAGSWSTSRRPASTPATRRARCRRSRWARPTCSRSAPPPRSWPRGSACAG